MALVRVLTAGVEVGACDCVSDFNIWTQKCGTGAYYSKHVDWKLWLERKYFGAFEFWKNLWIY